MEEKISLYEIQKKQLIEMYHSYYTMQNNTCQYYGECKEGMRDCDGGYDSTYSTLLGKNYNVFSNKGIRIMIVGKEYPGDNRCTEIKTPELVGHGDGYTADWHNKRTLQTLLMLYGISYYSKTTVKSLQKYNNLLTACCLTSYFKCSFKDDEQRSIYYNKRYNVYDNKRMKKHCGEILLNEIAILDPTIVVVQGKFYSDEFWHNELIYDTEKTKKGTKIYDEKKISAYLYDGGKIALGQKEYNKTPFFVIWGYDPTALYAHSWDNTSPILCDCIDEVEKYIDNNDNLHMQNLTPDDIEQTLLQK